MTTRREMLAGVSRLSWRRVTITIGLQIFAGSALWCGKLDAEIWAWFAGGLASMYIGGDTLEKVTRGAPLPGRTKEVSDG